MENRTLIVLFAVKSKIEFLPDVKEQIIHMIGSLRLFDPDDNDPSNAIFIKGFITNEDKQSIIDFISDQYENDITVAFIELQEGIIPYCNYNTIKIAKD